MTGESMSNLLDNMVFKKVGVPLMQSFLDLSSARHKLIAGNLTNVSTPGYRSKDLDFHAELRKELNKDGHIEGKLTNPAHIPVGASKDKGPDVIVNRTQANGGVNNVDVDQEVSNLAENQLYYSVGARLLAGKFQALKQAIRSK